MEHKVEGRLTSKKNKKTGAESGVLNAARKTMAKMLGDTEVTLRKRYGRNKIFITIKNI